MKFGAPGVPVAEVLAARHRHEYSKALLAVMDETRAHRANLRAPLRDRHGNMTRAPMHCFLMRHKPRAAAYKDGRPYKSPEQLDGRRADHFDVMAKFFTTVFACTDFRTWEVLEPDHDRAQQSPYPSVLRLCELAQIVPEDHELTDAPDCAWRARKAFDLAGLFACTEQMRAEDLKGGHYSTGGARRVLNVDVLISIGGPFGAMISGQHSLNQKLNEQIRLADAEFRRLVKAGDRVIPPRQRQGEPEAIPLPEDIAEIDKVHEEHPDWSFPACEREARRRRKQRPPAGGGAADVQPNTS